MEYRFNEYHLINEYHLCIYTKGKVFVDERVVQITYEESGEYCKIDNTRSS